jgi:hypothetical protein
VPRKPKLQVAGSPAEWVGARIRAPFEITGEGEPYAPDISMWLELPSGFILATKVHGPGRRDGGLAGALKDAMLRPAVGEPRVPPAVRVPTKVDARRMLDVVPEGVPVRVAPTPEIDRLVENMAEYMAGAGPDLSWLADERIAPADLKAYFDAARALYLLAPWRFVPDTHVMRVDVPECAIEGACLSIVGELAETLGFLLFPSLDDFDGFLDAAIEAEAGTPAPRDVAAGCITLTYERVSDLPEDLRRRLKSEDFAVAGPRAFPHLERRGAHGESVPLEPADLRLGTALILALASFAARYRENLRFPESDSIRASFEAAGGVKVTLSYPFDDSDLFADDFAPQRQASAPKRATSQVGRNDPCPCGSGRKYKKCHLEADTREAAASMAGTSGRDHVWESGIDGAEAQKWVREYKTRHYDAWVDDALPALGGMTPREAAKSAKHVRRLESLLADMESAEQAMPAGERYDFSRVRRKLGLES